MRRLSWISVVVVFGACNPEPSVDELVKDMVVQTSYDTNADFGQYGSYSMSLDTIGLVSNSSNASAIVSDYSKAITVRVKQNLDGCGWVRLEPDQSPDLGVTIYVVSNLSVYQSVSYPSYYYGSPGYTYGGYYGYYNYPYVNTYVSNRAVLAIEIVNLKSLNPQTKQPDLIWVANMGDLINSPDQQGKVLEAIDQAFVQSQYLKK